MLDLAALPLDEIAAALQDQTDFEYFHLINRETGELFFWTSYSGIDGHTPVELDDLDERLVVIEPVPSYIWYRDMVDFAEGISNGQASRRLLWALDGRGAFRRFRSELDRQEPRLQSAWRVFRETRAMRRAVEWLFENSLVDESAADRYIEEHPDPALP